MKKILLLFLSSLFFLYGCKQGGKEQEEMDWETSSYCSTLFDSLIWQQYHCPDDEEKTVYEWNWAYNVRETLGVEDLDSLTTLSGEMNESYHSYADSGITSVMTTATEAYAGTARFCMLNVYQALAELVVDTPLGRNDSYYYDYALWEELFKEFDIRYENAGNGRLIEVNGYYRQLAELRTEVLYEELAFFSEEKPLLEQFANAQPPQWNKQWIKSHPAIHRWYEHRIKMASMLQSHHPVWAQCIRALTYKQVTLYTQFEKETEEYYED